MIKRIICLLIIFAMCLSFAACSNSCSSTSSSNSVVSQVTSEGSSEGDDSGQDSSSSVGGGAQDDEGASQSEGDDSSNSDSGSGSDNADDNSGSDSDSDTDGANNGSGSDNGGTTGTQTGAGSAQSGFAITKQPVSTSVAVGAPLTLSVSASGSGTLTYKWYTSLTNGYDGIEMLGKTSSTVSLSTSNPFTQYYYCVITQVSTGATLTTNIATASAVGSAATPTPVSYNLWIGGVQVTSANAANVLGDGTVNFNGATNTLTLNGATILYDGTADERSPIHSGLNNLTINLNEESTLQSTGGANEESDGSSRALDGIYSTGTISINGTGTLNTTGGDHHNQAAGSGIYAGSGLTIYNGIINAKGGKSGEGGNSTGGEGIYTHTGISVTILGGTITAIGGFGEGRGGTGIYLGGNLYIYDNPTITAQGMGDADKPYNGEGIYTLYGITLGNADNPFTGSLTAICGAGGTYDKVYALNNDVTSYFFGPGMNYYTSTDGTTWPDAPTTSDLGTNNLPAGQNTRFGVHFGTSKPS